MLKIMSKVFGVAGYVIQYACITHCTFEYIGDFVICSGPSMEPTLYTNNILMTDRISPRLNRISRGDIIIAKSPTNPSQHICKRVVGMPGDRIAAPIESFENYQLNASSPTPNDDKIINIKNETLLKTERNLNQTISHRNNNTKSAIKEIIVPRGHVWIEGDNSQNSSDSRYYGPIPQGLIKSRVICRIWPVNKIKILT